MSSGSVARYRRAISVLAVNGSAVALVKRIYLPIADRLFDERGDRNSAWSDDGTKAGGKKWQDKRAIATIGELEGCAGQRGA